MTDRVHGELCQYTTSLLPYDYVGSTGGEGGVVGTVEHGQATAHDASSHPIAPKSGETGVPIPIISPPTPVATKKNLADDNKLDVQQQETNDPTEKVLYNPAFSDTNLGLDVQESTGKHKIATSEYDKNKNFLLLLMPRGTFKSSVVTIGFSLQYILQDPDARILIDSETYSKCGAFLSEIKGHLENNDKYREIFKTIHGVYPDQNKRDDKWTDSEINISGRKRKRKEPTFSSGGIGTTKTGMHYDLIIMDDVVSENNITNKEQIDKVIDHYKLALSLLDPGKPLIVIGTRWDYNDLYQYLLDNEADRFNIMVKKAILDDGSLLFPERLTKKFLAETKKSQGSYIFSCQYQNEPVDNESATFKANDFQKVEWDLVKDKPINWYLAIDPSFEGEYSDYAAFVVAGMSHQHELYVRYILRAKMTYGGIIEAMFDIYNRFTPKTVILETISHAKSLQYMLNDEQKKRGVWLPLREVHSRKNSKEERIRGLAPYYEYGHVYHVRGCHQLEDLEYELIHFPKGTHDDVVDALATVLEFAAPPSGRVTLDEDKKKRYDVFTKPRSPITGI